MSGLDDLHLLPKVRDSWSYLYVEHTKIDQDAKAIALHDLNGVTPVPCAALNLLMLGPGTTISHAAIKTLAEHGCLVVWTGEEAVRCYAVGVGETRSAQNILRQAFLWADETRRLDVVMRMYQRRFPGPMRAGLALKQIRGMEGIRVREAYARASRESGVPWAGRTYKRTRWADADPINRALSTANSALYGVCHAAIVAAGYSPAIGFIHTGKMLSFVYDIADLYKAEITIPAAFRATAEGDEGLERRTRMACRDLFHEKRLLQRIVADIDDVLSVHRSGDIEATADYDAEMALPAGLWDDEAGVVAGGENYAPAREDRGQ